MTDRISGSLQENLITLACYDDTHGRLIPNLVPLELYEGEYRTIAERAYDFWRVQGEAPKTHTADLFAEILEARNSRREPVIRNMLRSMHALAESGINAVYVIGRVTKFRRQQELKAAVLRAAEFLQSETETSIEEAEEILAAVSRARNYAFDAGIRFGDVDRVITLLESTDEFDTGIYELDRGMIVPQRGMIMILIAPTGYGKSWWLTHLGKRAFLRRKKVLHITNELSGPKTLKRYYQSMFSIPNRHMRRVDVTELDWDERLEKLEGFTPSYIEPEFSFDSDLIRRELVAHTGQYGARVNDLIVKEFPQKQLTMRELRGYLDGLEQVENFIPDLLILDQPGDMKHDLNNMRLSQITTYAELRGLCQERNMAGAFVHQSGKEGVGARFVKGTNAAEAFGINMVADFVLTYSQTKSEQRLKLARLLVDKARDDAGGFGMIITQAYDIGQFVLQSMPLHSDYWDFMDAEARRDHSEDEGDDDA